MIPAASEDVLRSDTGREGETAVLPDHHHPVMPGAVAREAGIRYPVALTAAAWEKCVTVPAGVPCRDEPGRPWDVRCCAIR
jgi:hypothetical protein